MSEALREEESSIIPQPGKETGVWHALDALYYGDNIPLSDITHDRILDKRRMLEGKAGDRSGLKGMIARWCKKNKISLSDDPKRYHAKKTKQVIDPVQKITANLYAEIEDTVRAELANELEQLNNELNEKNEQLENLESKYQKLKTEQLKLFNDYQQQKDELTTSNETTIAAKAKMQLIKEEFDTYRNQTEYQFQQAKDNWIHELNNQKQILINNQESKVEQICQLQKQFQLQLSEQKEANTKQLHKYMLENDKLKTELGSQEIAYGKLKTKLTLQGERLTESTQQYQQLINLNHHLKEKLEQIEDKQTQDLRTLQNEQKHLESMPKQTAAIYKLLEVLRCENIERQSQSEQMNQLLLTQIKELRMLERADGK